MEKDGEIGLENKDDKDSEKQRHTKAERVPATGKNPEADTGREADREIQTTLPTFNFLLPT